MEGGTEVFTNPFDWNGKYDSRDSGALKMVFTPAELAMKPIKFWANVGTVDDESIFKKLSKHLKQLVGVNWDNSNHYLTYYAGSRIVHPFHVLCEGDGGWGITIYSIFGDQSPSFSLSGSSPRGLHMLSKCEVEQMNDFLRDEYHFIQSSLRTMRKYMTGEKGYMPIERRVSELDRVLRDNVAMPENPEIAGK